LYDFDIARHARREPIARLLQLNRRQVSRPARDTQLLAAGLQIEQRRADFVIDAGFEIFRIRSTAPEVRVRLEQLPPRAPTLEDRHLHRADDEECTMRVGERVAEIAVIRGDADS